VSTKSNIKELKKEKEILLEELNNLRISIDELTNRKAEMQIKLDDPSEQTYTLSSSSYVIDDILVESDEAETKQFNKFFNAKDPFLEETRRILLED